jgi:hypothetical protein
MVALYYAAQPLSQTTGVVSWSDVIGGILGGILLLGFAAAIRALVRIEHAVMVARFEHAITGPEPAQKDPEPARATPRRSIENTN